MLRVLLLFSFSSLVLACSGHDSIYAPENTETDQGPAKKLSYVATPNANGTRCMYDQSGILYWSDIGITATVLHKEQWVYHTYTWEYIGIQPSIGKVSYGINNGRLTFPGNKLAIWTPK